MGKRKQKQKKQGGGGNNWTQLSIGNALAASARVVRRLTQAVGVINVGATGLVSERILSSQCANCAEWPSMAAVYVQYRVIEIRITLCPFTTAGQADGILVMGTDRSGALAAITTVTAAWGLTMPKVFSLRTLTKPAQYTAKAIDLEDQDYTPVGAPVPLFSIQYSLAASGLVSVPALFRLNEFVVEFKGTQA